MGGIDNRGLGRVRSETLLKERWNAKEHMLAELQSQLEGLKRFQKSPHHLVNTLIKQALETERFIDRTFWLSSVSDILSDLPQSLYPLALYQLALYQLVILFPHFLVVRRLTSANKH